MPRFAARTVTAEIERRRGSATGGGGVTVGGVGDNMDAADADVVPEVEEANVGGGGDVMGGPAVAQAEGGGSGRLRKKTQLFQFDSSPWQNPR